MASFSPHLSGGSARRVRGDPSPALGGALPAAMTRTSTPKDFLLPTGWLSSSWRTRGTMFMKTAILELLAQR